MKKLSELLSATTVGELLGDSETAIHGLTYDSRAVGAGDCFFAVPGTLRDGHDFIPAAVGLVDSWADIAGHLVAYVAVTVLTTFVVMGVAGLVTQRMIRRGKEGR